MNKPLSGFLLINKPVGLTSFQVVKKIRYLTKAKKVGHAGTLDPFASGLLILAMDRNYTRQIDKIQSQAKVYTFSIVFGVETDTLDSYGSVKSVGKPSISREQVESVLPKFHGEIEQIPPIFSAKKIDGKRLYDLARSGETDIELKPNNISIYNIKLESFQEGVFPQAVITLNCSKGTYVRSLVRDISAELGTIGYTRDLVRTRIGQYQLESALDYSSLSAEEISTAMIR